MDTQVELRSRVEKLDDPLLTKALNEHETLVVQAQEQADKYVQKFRDQGTLIHQAVELCKTFKRIDISFLQMAKEGKPVFAFMPYDQYRAGGTVYWNRKGYYLNKGDEPIFGELFAGAAFDKIKVDYDPSDPRATGFREFEEAMRTGTWNTSRKATLEHTALRKVPETVEAFVDQNRKKFDKVWIAEEASWHPSPKDPLVIGQRGTFFFLIAWFNPTQMEAYLAKEFTSEEGEIPAS